MIHMKQVTGEEERSYERRMEETDRPDRRPREEEVERRYRREYSRGLGDTQLDYDDDEEEPIPDWVFQMLWWPVSILGFVLRVIGRFSKLAFLLTVSAATYFWIYSAMVPPSLSEHHPINFEYPALRSERDGGVPANATVDFAFQRQLMLRSGARGMDWCVPAPLVLRLLSVGGDADVPGYAGRLAWLQDPLSMSACRWSCPSARPTMTSGRLPSTSRYTTSKGRPSHKARARWCCGTRARFSRCCRP